MDARRGMALVLVAGIAALLALLAMAFVFGVRSAGAAGHASLRAFHAASAAESGMEYAASRLLRDSSPRHSPDSSDRGDDWTCRGEGGGQRLLDLNPSYAHGKAWADASALPDGIDNDGDGEADEAGEADRLLAPGDVPAVADGAPTACSCRLRGPGSPRARLRIGSDHSRISLNLGVMSGSDGKDNDEDGPIDEPDEAMNVEAQLNRALNQLGAALRDPLTGEPVLGGALRWEIPTSGEPIAISRLGRDLVANRPVGGYRTWEQVEEGLLWNPACFGGSSPYVLDQVEALKPYLSLRRGDAPLSLRSVPVPVLEALFTGMVVPISSGGTGGIEPAGPALACSYSGLPYEKTRLVTAGQARRVALAVAAERQGDMSWRSLRERISREADSLFAEDWDGLSPAPVYRDAYVQSKAGSLFASICPEVVAFCGYSSTWWGWGIDLDRQPSNGTQLPPPPRAPGWCRLPEAWDPASSNPWPDGDLGYPYSRADVRSPLKMTLSPPLDFTIESRGAFGSTARFTRTVVGDLRVLERIELTSQEDFEAFSEPIFLACGATTAMSRRGIAVTGFPPEVQMDCAKGLGAPRIVSLPAGSFRAYTSPGAFFPNGVDDDGDGRIDEVDDLAPPSYSGGLGALGLGPYDAGLSGAQLHWPMTRDVDGRLNMRFDPVTRKWGPDPDPIPWSEFWSRHDPEPSPGWITYYPMPPYRLSHQRWHPYSVTARGPDVLSSRGWSRFQWPGLHRIDLMPDGSQAFHKIRATIQARMETGSSITCSKTSGGALSLSSVRGEGGTRFRLDLGPWVLVSPNGQLTFSRSWVVDHAQSGNQAVHDVVLVVEHLDAALPEDPNRTRFTLYVDGANASRDGPMVHEAVGQMDPGTSQGAGISLECIGEVRLFSRALASPPAVAPRYVRYGRYVSPLYAPDRPFTLSQAQWFGLGPFGKGNPFRVTVIGYSDAAGNVEAARATLPGGPERVHELASLGFPAGLGSFRYEVEIDCGTSAYSDADMQETPIFDSIWLTFRRQGGATGWTAWEAR